MTVSTTCHYRGIMQLFFATDRTLLLFLQSYNPSHRPKSPILISILITLGTSNRVSAAARREQSHRRTGCSPRKRETGTHSDQSTHTIQSGATAAKSLLCNSPPDLLRQYPSSKVTIKHNLIIPAEYPTPYRYTVRYLSTFSG